MEENKEKKENKIKFSEKASLFFRRKWLVDGTKTFLIVAILIASFIALNLWVGTLDLPEIDVTENKVFTLTDASKDAVKNIENDIKIYAYGFAEDFTLMSFLKQYNEANPKITSEILTEETNITIYYSDIGSFIPSILSIDTPLGKAIETGSTVGSVNSKFTIVFFPSALFSYVTFLIPFPDSPLTPFGITKVVGAISSSV